MATGVGLYHFGYLRVAARAGGARDYMRQGKWIRSGPQALTFRAWWQARANFRRSMSLRRTTPARDAGAAAGNKRRSGSVRVCAPLGAAEWVGRFSRGEPKEGAFPITCTVSPCPRRAWTRNLTLGRGARQARHPLRAPAPLPRRAATNLVTAGLACAWDMVGVLDHCGFIRRARPRTGTRPLLPFCPPRMEFSRARRFSGAGGDGVASAQSPVRAPPPYAAPCRCRPRPGDRARRDRGHTWTGICRGTCREDRSRGTGERRGRAIAACAA